MSDDNDRMTIFRPIYRAQQVRHIRVRSKLRLDRQLPAGHPRQRFCGLNISLPVAAIDPRAVGQARIQPIRHLGGLFSPFTAQFAGKIVPVLNRDSIRVSPQNEIHTTCSNKLISGISQGADTHGPSCHEAVTIGS